MSSVTFSNKVNSLTRIRSRLPTLAAAERHVAQWILQHAEEVMHTSMAQVGVNCGVSDTTVLRFCRAAGFQGYTDLRLSIARDLASPTQIVHDDIAEGDDEPTIAQKVFMSHVQALYDTLEMLNEADLRHAVKMILDAERILIVGVGTSIPIVHEAYNKFFRLGLNCRVQTDSYLMLMEAAIVGPETLVLAVSHSGGSTDPIITLQEAKSHGAKTIVITGTAESPLTQYADVTFLAMSQETRREAIASRIAQMTLVDTLYIIMSLYMLETTTQNEDRIWEAVTQKTM